MATVNQATNLAAAATTVIATASPGRTLVSVICNKPGTTDTVTVYDGVTAGGRKIAGIAAPTVGANFNYNAFCPNGICVVVGGTAGDYTIVWR